MRRLGDSIGARWAGSQVLSLSLACLFGSEIADLGVVSFFGTFFSSPLSFFISFI